MTRLIAQPCHPDRSAAKQAKWRDLVFSSLSKNCRALLGWADEGVRPYASKPTLHSNR